MFFFYQYLKILSEKEQINFKKLINLKLSNNNVVVYLQVVFFF